MNAYELARELLKLPPDTPVVMGQEDEPLGGAYGVAAIELMRMKLDRIWADPEVWDHHGGYTIDPALVDVCYLDFREPITQVVGEDVVVQPSAVVTAPAVEAPYTWRQIVARSLTPGLPPRRGAGVAALLTVPPADRRVMDILDAIDAEDQAEAAIE